MKVAFICRDPVEKVGGISTHVAGLTGALSNIGIESEVFALGDSPLNVALSPWTIGKRLKGFDVIHVQAPPYGPYMKRLGKPVVCTVHSPLSEERRFYATREKRLRGWLGQRGEDRSFKEADAIIAVSEFTRRCIVERDGADPSKIHVIPNGVDLEGFYPDKMPCPHLPMVLACSRRDPRKNLAMTEEALEYVADRGMVLRAMGGVPRDEVASMFQKADVFISTSCSEGFNLTLLEAMASGCACLASDIPAHRELLGDSGVLYHDEAHLKSWLDILLASEVERKHFGWRARMRAEHYPWGRAAEMTKKVYEEVLA